MKRYPAFKVWIEFAWYDLWIGAFVSRKWDATRVYLCLLPCVPIVMEWRRNYRYPDIFPPHPHDHYPFDDGAK